MAVNDVERPVLSKQTVFQGSPDFQAGWLRGIDAYQRGGYDEPIDGDFVMECVRAWHRRGLFDGQWNDVLEFHIGYVAAMVYSAVTEQ